MGVFLPHARSQPGLATIILCKVLRFSSVMGWCVYIWFNMYPVLQQQ